MACDLNAVGVAERVREFAAQGVDARPCAGDLTQPDIAALAVEMALRHFGRLDVVVNVAGGLTTYGPIEKLTVADFDREMAINLKTTVLVSQAAIPALAETQGCIVNFASIAYFEPQSPMAVYSAAKAAVAGFTRSLALELRGPPDPGERDRAGHGAHRPTTSPPRARAPRTSSWTTSPRGVMALAAPGAGASTGEIRPIAPTAPAADGAARAGRAGDRRRAPAGPGDGAGAGRPRHDHGASTTTPRPTGARALRDEIAAAGGRAECFAADLTDAGRGARAAAAVVAERFGRLDVLVNSAAVMHRSRFEETTPEQYDADPRPQSPVGLLLHPGRGAGAAAARGKVVNMADLGGLEPWPGFAAHSVSKAGVVMLTKVLARALAPDVTVNAIAPGAVLVPEEYDAAERERLARTTPLARLGRPEDAVAALLYLLEGGDYVTGEVLVVDGGRLLR